MTKLFNTKRILFLLFILFILIRLPFLDQINLLHDERDIVLSGWSIARTGKDLFGKPFPLVFENISPNNPLIAIYFAALWFLFVPLKSVFFARLPFLLISALIVFICFKLVKFITGDDKKSLITTAVLCFNPWIFHITRLALDIPLALVFLFGGILLYLQKKKFLALILFFLTAFTYQGSRLLIPFLLIYLELFFLIKQKSWRSFFFSSFINLCFFISIITLANLIEPTISKNRLSEIIFFDFKKISQTVDFKRRTSIAPLLVSRFFDNKITSAFDEVVLNLSKGFDISYLFKSGDYSAINANAVTGQFLFIYIIFYFIGIIFLGRKSNRYDFYILGFIPLGMIPAVLSTHGLSFSIRGVLSSLGFSYLISLGIIFFIQLLKGNKFKIYLITPVILIFFINLSYFIYGYYFRRPITVGELFKENERQLSNFLIKSDKNYTIYHQSAQDMLLSYLFFQKNLSMNKVQKNLKSKNYAYDNLIFFNCNHKIDYLSVKNTIIHDLCLENETYEILNDINNKKVALRIPYQDFSQKTAYFVIE
ncbi:hypothetical protein A3I50_02690 [Candidatus Roizmanbacteria bacterium RIFCSPLOWO2_02_FULL_37_9]|nr:MAG: hypothetical protein A2859_04610 [Candidatus Roizmanbacteria bacterium RIFCSPHIGHO2_01_FULL_37_16b]OGK32349.1 MAG: hypothetical protein A3F57_05495 [Candidatus Roizmanbacteria bacterium RIFCSPHIGHO2_12_FULL_36_11]OGK55739.1 MAG: hypothetical protein A3I50_02690 [Candidatus Roizmanbacteria bacterium RIFCSPLOWO2_02_FULL_37_9]